MQGLRKQRETMAHGIEQGILVTESGQSEIPRVHIVHSSSHTF